MMAAIDDFTFRRCCDGALDVDVKIYVGTPATPSLAVGAVVDFIEPSQLVIRDLRLARHEAAHAIVAHALGVSLAEVRVDPPAQATYAGSGKNATERVAMALAGPMADALAEGGKPTTTCTVAFRTLMRRIRSCRFGKCDECSAALNERAAMRRVMTAITSPAAKGREADVVAALMRGSSIEDALASTQTSPVLTEQAPTAESGKVVPMHPRGS